jgi:hypothetical protein
LTTFSVFGQSLFAQHLFKYRTKLIGVTLFTLLAVPKAKARPWESTGATLGYFFVDLLGLVCAGSVIFPSSPWV